MGDKSTIEWTEATWNVLVGCSAVSPGCDRCYAERQSATRLKNVPAYKGLVDDHGKWTGEIRFLPERLDQPLRWARPRRIFVNSMSDLFHPDVPLDVLAQIWEVMHRAHQERGHTFQILTKRPQRMAKALGPHGIGWYAVEGPVSNPEPGIWLGTSIESQQYAFRARHLLNTPAAVRFISAEPLLSALDLTEHFGTFGVKQDGYRAGGPSATRIDWVIVGGESGAGARPMHPKWARQLRDQCQQAGVAFLFKQWGEWAPSRTQPYIRRPVSRTIDVDGTIVGEYDDPPDSWTMWRVGKHEAGRVLDGRTWDEYPTEGRVAV